MSIQIKEGRNRLKSGDRSSFCNTLFDNFCLLLGHYKLTNSFRELKIDRRNECRLARVKLKLSNGQKQAGQGTTAARMIYYGRDESVP